MIGAGVVDAGTITSPAPSSVPLSVLPGTLVVIGGGEGITRAGMGAGVGGGEGIARAGMGAGVGGIAIKGSGAPTHTTPAIAVLTAQTHYVLS